MNRTVAQSRLLIIWHSRTGAAQAMAQAAWAGADSETTGGALMIDAKAATPADMLGAGGYLFVCPENLGAVSGEMKELFDRTYYALLGQVEGRGYATAVAAGSAGFGAQAQIDRIATGWRLRRVAPSLIVRVGAETPAVIAAPKYVSRNDLQKCHDLGQLMIAGLQLGIF